MPRAEKSSSTVDDRNAIRKTAMDRTLRLSAAASKLATVAAFRIQQADIGAGIQPFEQHDVERAGLGHVPFARLPRGVADERHEKRDQRARDEQDQAGGPGPDDSRNQNRQGHDGDLDGGKPIAREPGNQEIEFGADQRRHRSGRAWRNGKWRSEAFAFHESRTPVSNDPLRRPEGEPARGELAGVAQQTERHEQRHRQQRALERRLFVDQRTDQIGGKPGLSDPQQRRSRGQRTGRRDRTAARLLKSVEHAASGVRLAG